ncbi:small subunit ribosomal protein S16 [Aeromicrobium panaciterrae]|uniref:Small ribosomal subunit protein bS16 n=1 Tax=Aeromicrobium panaciterrae TaxID=363861 RepID=A0ABU1UQI0_9ACTN|nr:small subunit ribosomal protein S16 [Aeromicrobium panaciterrae]
MAVKIRLKRMGKIRTPFYRIVIADSRTKRDGRVIEEIGTYNPKADPSIIKIDGDRAKYWLGVGAQPTEAVAALLKITGDIGGKNTMKFAEPKRDKEEIFQEALKELHSDNKADAVTRKAAAAKKAAAAAEDEAKEATTAKKKADTAPSDEAKADAPVESPADEAPAAEEAKAEEPAAEEAPAEAAPAEEAKADEAPADEAKAEEPAAEEAPADEAKA